MIDKASNHLNCSNPNCMFSWLIQRALIMWRLYQELSHICFLVLFDAAESGMSVSMIQALKILPWPPGKT